MISRCESVELGGHVFGNDFHAVATPPSVLGRRIADFENFWRRAILLSSIRQPEDHRVVLSNAYITGREHWEKPLVITSDWGLFRIRLR